MPEDKNKIPEKPGLYFGKLKASGPGAPYSHVISLNGKPPFMNYTAWRFVDNRTTAGQIPDAFEFGPEVAVPVVEPAKESDKVK